MHLTLSLISYWHLAVSFLAMTSAQTPSEISANVSAILNHLVHANDYDKRLRPNYGGDPVDVAVTIYVSGISSISEVQMDYTLDLYLRQVWVDNRLEFRSYDRSLTIGADYMKQIWVPDTFFPNEKKSYFHDATTHNSFLRIRQDGRVTTSQRLTVTANCPMNMKMFPLDSQDCSLELESYGYSTADINLVWGNDKVTISENVVLPQFEIVNLTSSDMVEKLSTGNYSRIASHFTFKRRLEFYFIQIYLPSSLIVIISWVSFWLSREATPARVQLGITTVLTMTTLMTTTNAGLPKVSYIKSIDIYLITCYSMVFAALLEYAVVCYLGKVIKRRKAKISSMTDDSMAPAPFEINRRRVSNKRHADSPIDVSSFPLLGSTDTTGMTEEICTCGLLVDENHSTVRTIAVVKKPKKPGRKRPIIAVTPSMVDKNSRIFFPICFLVFNIIYWGYYNTIRNSQSA